MRVVKQKQTIPVENWDIIASNPHKAHSPLLPSSIRAVICGPSNCGKTNAMLSLLINPYGLKFENIYIYSKSLHQPKYQILAEILKPINELGYYTFDTHEEVIDPSNAKPNSIFVFDDVICEKQERVRDYFSRGRHNAVDCFYLSQTYTRIPKHLIRDNVNFLILFKQDDLNLKHVYDDHVTTDMTYQQFKIMCKECWKDKYGFLTIDKDSSGVGRYRKGFDTFIHLL